MEAIGITDDLTAEMLRADLAKTYATDFLKKASVTAARRLEQSASWLSIFKRAAGHRPLLIFH